MTSVKMVAVGVSLGGLTALRSFLRPLPTNFAPAIAIAQHRRADADSHLADLLASACALPVIEPEDKEPICDGHVYVAPANYHLLVAAGVCWLTVDAPVSYARPSIDVLFESVADTYGPAGIAVVLTGSSDDGAAGTRAIKRAGGTVLVQDPRTAESPILPRAAIATGAVDGILPLPKLVDEVLALVATRGGGGHQGKARSPTQRPPTSAAPAKRARTRRA
jgi:two-component system, chemotaxis family, protein-glutamate methylesterase/glutaminase